MSENLQVSQPKFQLNTMRLVAGIFFVITALISAFNVLLRDLPGYFNFVQTSGIAFPASLALYHYLFVSVSLPLACLALAVFGIFAKSNKIWAIASGVYFILCWPLSFVMTWLLQNNFDFSHWQLLWTGNELLDSGATVTFIVASFIAVASMFVNLGQPVQITSMNQNARLLGHDGAPVSNLPIFALVGAVILPLVGIILGHISLRQMKRGCISSQNRSLATIGLVLGYVFTVLSIFVFIIYLSLLALASNIGY